MRLSFASVLVLCSVLPHFAFADQRGGSSGGGDAVVASFYDARYKEIKLQQETPGVFDIEKEVQKKPKVESVESKKLSPGEIAERVKRNACVLSPDFIRYVQNEVAAVYPESSTIRINRSAWQAISKDETSKSFVILYTAYKLAGTSNADLVSKIQGSLERSGKCVLPTTPTYKAKAKPSAAPAAAPTGAVGGQD